MLAGGLATLPMAPLADVPHKDVPEIIRRIDARLIQEAQAALAGKIMAATLALAGLAALLVGRDGSGDQGQMRHPLQEAVARRGRVG